MVARVVGFGRTVVFGNAVSDTAVGSVYTLVNAVPNIVFEVVAGGALASLVVPLLAGPVAAGDHRRVAAIASSLLLWTVALLASVAAVVALANGPILDLLNVPADMLPMGRRMLWVFAPQIPLYGVAVVLTGVLQAHRRFLWPVLAPLLSSVTVITAYLSFAAVAGARPDAGAVSRGAELILTAGTTAGVAVLGLCLVVPVRRLRLGWDLTAKMPEAARRTVAGLAGVAVVTVLGQQLAQLAMLAHAGAGPPGTPVQFNFAQTVFLLPWAVLAVPVATAVYPGLATAAAERDDTRFAATLAPAVRAAALLSALGAALLVALAGPAADVLLGSAGRFALADGIAASAPGLLGYGLFAVLSRALYARGAVGLAAATTGAGWLAVIGGTFALPLLLPVPMVPALLAAQSAGLLLLGALMVGATSRIAGPAALAGLGRAASTGLVAAVVSAAGGWALEGVLPGLLPAWTPAVAGALRAAVVAPAVMLLFLAVAYPLDRHDLRPALARLRALRSRRRG
ncbi:lipid II flippase MurJ [Pilimelia columellifera subsp. columellifera]|uniref:Lipid II flippase MurJ n=1 Tax=Pilimelia columellifera subsp. columellifera TaxID=706583 RepID=A0ABN3NRB0_9ACTN